MIKLLETYNARVLGFFVPLALILIGGYFLLRLHQLWRRPLAFVRRVVRGGGGKGVSPMRAMSLSLAGVLGVGNLVGVASALLYGGAGAVFWMWVSATFAMFLKYAEVVLAMRHRRSTESGASEGCAMYYIEDAFAGKSRRFGKLLAVLFGGLLLIDALCMGCVIQVNAISTALIARLPLHPMVVGALLGAMVLFVGLRGGRSIARAAEGLVPFMTAGFCFLSIVAIARRGAQIPKVLEEIFREGLCLNGGGERGILGGIGAFLFSRGVRFGTARGLLSNEAGCGTSPMAHADAATDDPVAQGGMGMLEVFVDTHLLCTMTALVILLAFSGEALPDLSPMMLTLSAFERLLGAGVGWFLCGAVVCFGFATVLCWSHYTLRAGAYLFGRVPGDLGERRRISRLRDTLFLLIYAVFVFLGSFMPENMFWYISDVAIGTMTLLNVAVLWKCRREIVSVSKMTPRAKATRGMGNLDMNIARGAGEGPRQPQRR